MVCITQAVFHIKWSQGIRSISITSITQAFSDHQAIRNIAIALPSNVLITQAVLDHTATFTRDMHDQYKWLGSYKLYYTIQMTWSQGKRLIDTHGLDYKAPLYDMVLGNRMDVHQFYYHLYHIIYDFYYRILGQYGGPSDNVLLFAWNLWIWRLHTKCIQIEPISSTKTLTYILLYQVFNAPFLISECLDTDNWI